MKYNKEFLAAAILDEMDDWGAAEAWIYYHLNCPYRTGDRRCHCYPEEYRNGTMEELKYKDCLKATREMCSECKYEWLNQEVHE